MPKRPPKTPPAPPPAEDNGKLEVDPSSFYQKLFDRVMAVNPQLEEHGETIAGAVTYIVTATYHEARRYTAAQIIEHLTDFWKLTGKSATPAMKAVQNETLDSIKGLMALEGSNQSDIIGRTIGSA